MMQQTILKKYNMYFGRNKNKIQGLHGIHDIYDFYFSKLKGNELYDVDYKIYRDIINKYFYVISKEILYGAYEMKFPHRLGSLRIIKRKVDINKLTKFGIDWVETVKNHKVIYYLNSHSKNYIYRYKWIKGNMTTPNLYFYKFVSSRANKRELAKIIKSKQCDYFE
jgi:hypothetical protein